MCVASKALVARTSTGTSFFFYEVLEHWFTRNTGVAITGS